MSKQHPSRGGKRKRARAAYLRFTVPAVDPRSGSSAGIFTAAYALRDDPTLAYHEQLLLEEILAWYRTHLVVPACLKEPGNRRALCWFTDHAGHAMKKMWTLVALLRERGILVRLERTDDPGLIVWENPWQVVARPRR